MPAPVVASVVSDWGTTSSLVIDKPSGVTPGDLLVIVAGLFGNNTFTPPSGFTQRVTSITTYSPDYVRSAIFDKVADGSEGADFTIGASASTDIRASILRVTGADPAAPFDSSANVSSSNYVQEKNIPSLTTSGPDRLLVAVQQRWYTGLTTEPAGWTIITEDYQTSHSSWYKTQAAAGASGQTDFNQSGVWDLFATSVASYAFAPEVPARGRPAGWRRSMGLR